MFQPSSSEHQLQRIRSSLPLLIMFVSFLSVFLLAAFYLGHRNVVICMEQKTAPLDSVGYHYDEGQHDKDITKLHDDQQHQCDCVSSPPIVFPLNDPYHYFVAWKVNNDVHWSVQTYFPQDALTVKDLTVLLTSPTIDHINHVMKHLHESGVHKDGIDSVCTKHEQCAVTRLYPLANHHEAVFAEMHPPLHQSTGSESILWETRPSVLTYSDWECISKNGTLSFITDALSVM